MSIVKAFSRLLRLLLRSPIREIENRLIELRGENLQVEAGCYVKRVRFQDNIRIGVGSSIIDASIGRCSYIAGNALINNASIGSFCSIGPGVMIAPGKHPACDFFSTSPVFYSTRGQCGVTFSRKNIFIESESVEIGSDVWIGARAIILDGVKIQTGAIIAAGAVVIKDVEAFSIVGGVPARVIGRRFEESKYVDALLHSRWWEVDDSELQLLASFTDGKVFDWLSYLENMASSKENK